MKKTIVVLTLLFAATAQADHHRGHALGFIEGVETQNKLMRTRLDKYVALAGDEGCVFPDKDLTSIEVIYRYSGFIDDNMAIVRGILESGGDLDEARRKITRPNGDPPNSANTLMEGLIHRSRMLMNSCPQANLWLAQVQHRLAFMWTGIDRIDWHIQDAIREEVYLDPDFICSGPNNHCE